MVEIHLECLRNGERASASKREGTWGDGPDNTGLCRHEAESGIYSSGISKEEPSERPTAHKVGGAFVIVTHSNPSPSL